MKKKKEEFNDLLIPILLVICILPFVIHLAEYTCGYSKYAWYSDNDVIMDLYSYYRCYFFEILAIFTVAVLAFRMGLYKEKRKSGKVFLPLVLYGIMAVISAVLSVNPSASFSGNFYQFQGIVVLLGYLIMGFYTYQIVEKERDYQILWYAMVVVLGIMTIVGVFQIFKQDLLNFTWVQRFVMSKEQFELYQGTIDTVFTGSNVFLTLYNPNYAGVFLTMMVSVFFVMFYSEKDRRRKLLTGLGLLVCLILLWFTYSRASLVAVFVALLVFLFLERKRFRVIVKYLLPGLLALAVGFVVIDGINDFHFLSRMVDEKRDTSLKEILTTEDGIEITYEDSIFLAYIEDGKAVVKQQAGEAVAITEAEANEIIIQTKQPISLYAFEQEEISWLNMLINETTFTFGKQEDGYFYLNENGKQDALAEIPKMDFKGLEYLGSGRMYIWSRVLPMLKDYLLVGSGADTFAEVFPQNDYVGKAIYADTPARIMEKPHNDYLLQWVQNGCLAMLGLLCFYILYIRRCVSAYGGRSLDSMQLRLGFGCFLGCICYIAASLFNDSTLYTTPLFWVFAGISLAAAYRTGEE